MKVPRWGFRIGWEDFLVGLRAEANRYGLRVDDKDLKTGIVPLPDTAQYDGWDLRPLAAHCRDREPHEWLGAIRASLFEMYGRQGDVEVVAAAPPTARVVTAANVTTKPTPTLRERLRVQVFGDAFVSGRKLDVREVAMKELGDAWLVVVEDRGGGAEAIVPWEAVRGAGLARDEAFAIAAVNALAITARGVQIRAAEVAGARVQVFATSPAARYLGACLLDALAQRTAPCIVAPMTWLHWIVVELAPDATAATLQAVKDVVEPLRASIVVPAEAWISPTYWWWAPGKPPEPFSIDGVLPFDLERAITSPTR